MMADPPVSVIVPVWNDQDRIGSCIEALRNQTLRRELYEIIVVDNGSTDATCAVVGRYPDVILLREPRPGSYAARNAGLAKARGEYVAFTDSDCIPEPNWLAAGLQAIKHRDAVGVVAGRVAFIAPQGRYSRACMNFERQLSMRQDISAKKGFAITANWFSRRSVLEHFGGFDAGVKSGGDYMLSKRIYSSGLKIVYVPEALVRHPARAQFGQIFGKIRRVVAGRWTAETRRFRFARRFRIETRNLVERFRIVSNAQGLTRIERCEVVGLIVMVWLIAMLEVVRLQLGGVPARS